MNVQRIEIRLFLEILRKKWKIISISSIVYMIIYMIFTGIVQYYPRLNLADYFPNIPYIRISNIGIEIALSNHIYMLIFWNALIFMFSSSILVSLNLATLIHSRSYGCCGKKEASRSAIAFLAPLFVVFPCCAGPFLIALVGPFLFSFLFLYSSYIMIAVILILIFSFLNIFNRLLKTYKNSNCCF